MRVDFDHVGHPLVRLSMRNLQVLLAKAERPDSRRMIVSTNCWRGGEPMVGERCLLTVMLGEGPPRVEQVGAHVVVQLTIELLQELVAAPSMIELDGVPVYIELDEQHYQRRFMPFSDAAIERELEAGPAWEVDDAQTELEQRRLRARAVAERLLGASGWMITQSKSWYRSRYPEHFVVFNAKLCLDEGPFFWSGDLDVDESARKLMAVAEEIGEPVYLLAEMDAVWENEERPLVENARAVVSASEIASVWGRPPAAWDATGRRIG